MGGVFESFPTFLVGSAGSEGFLIFWGFFGPLFPCVYDFFPKGFLGGAFIRVVFGWSLKYDKNWGCNLLFPLFTYLLCPLSIRYDRI